MSRHLAAVALIALSLAAGRAACSSGTCGTVQAYGGNVVGTWKISSFCTEPAAPDPAAPTGCVLGQDASGLMLSGTLTFNADGTYSEAMEETGSLGVTVPSGCRTADRG